MSTVLQQLNAEMASVVDEVERCVVHVMNGAGGAGAATIWHPDGLIVTNAHVIQRHPLTITMADGRVFPARLLALDRALDLAALVVDCAGLPAIKLGDSRSLQPGQWVMALGHPWGVRDCLTAGVVIGTQWEVDRSSRHSHEWVVVSLHLRPGYSGGPLLDSEGRLVGVNTRMDGADVGLAVPVHVVKSFLRETLGSAQMARSMQR